MKALRIGLGVGVLLLGVASGLAAAKLKVSSSLYNGKSPEEAAGALLTAGEALAEKGSWELIFVGRTRYLSGDKVGGRAMLDRVAGGSKVEGGDLIRVGRVYWEAGEWELARPLFDRVLSLEPKDADWLAEIGAYYNLKGDRAHAEELFARSLAEDPANVYNTVKMAGSYLGVVPD
jgi:tetratricopeptide (TPR) repeat protein